jgi:hypothetical protein
MLLVAAIGMLFGFGSQPAMAADVAKVGKVTGIANNKVSIVPFDDRIENKLAVFTCSSEDVQKMLGRLPEAGDHVLYLVPEKLEPDKKDDEKAAKEKADEIEKKRCILSMRTETVTFFQRAAAAGGAAFLIILIASLAAGSPPTDKEKRVWFGAPTKFLVGSDNRFSNSQVQLGLWFGMAMTMYLAMLVLRIVMLDGYFIDGVALTANVMALTGLSALTFGGAKVVTAQKVENADAAGGGRSTPPGPGSAAPPTSAGATTSAGSGSGTVVTSGSVTSPATSGSGSAVVSGGSATALPSSGNVTAPATSGSGTSVLSGGSATALPSGGGGPSPTGAAAQKPRADKPRLTDLFQNDHGEVDIGDFQMVLVALTAVLVFGASCFSAMATLSYQVHVSLPDVDTSLLAGFGIGQGAYLVKKAALPLGKG